MHVIITGIVYNEIFYRTFWLQVRHSKPTKTPLDLKINATKQTKLRTHPSLFISCKAIHVTI